MHQAGFSPVVTLVGESANGFESLSLVVLVRLDRMAPTSAGLRLFRAFSRAQELPQPLLRMGCGGRAAPVSFPSLRSGKETGGGS